LHGDAVTAVTHRRVVAGGPEAAETFKRIAPRDGSAAPIS
jgi:hypothetical protein